jgi:hypothetical protein
VVIERRGGKPSAPFLPGKEVTKQKILTEREKEFSRNPARGDNKIKSGGKF